MLYYFQCCRHVFAYVSFPPYARSYYFYQMIIICFAVSVFDIPENVCKRQSILHLGNVNIQFITFLRLSFLANRIVNFGLSIT